MVHGELKNRGKIVNPIINFLLMGIDFDIVIIGGGGAGMISALAASQSGASVLLLEKTKEIGGHTLNTQGMFPASYTRFQKALGIVDSPEDMTKDILAENGNSVPYETVHNLSLNSSIMAEWLTDYCGQELEVATDFKYHGYTKYRIHSPPSRTGREIISTLLSKSDNLKNLEIVTEHGVSEIEADKKGNATGLKISGSGEKITARAIIITTGGYGANKEFVEKYMPDAGKMRYFGSSEHRGESLIWGESLGAHLDYLDSYQAHSAVSSVGTLITWETVMKGAIIVNSEGKRFANEITGYSKFAKNITQQPGSFAFEIYNSEIHEEVMQRYPEYQETNALNGILKAETIEELEKLIGCRKEYLNHTIEEVNIKAANAGSDKFGRSYFVELSPPYYTAKIYPALFHTQGGIRVGKDARVLLKNGTESRNIFAAGDAAAGITGPGPDGYVSGTGLLCAFTYGWLSGKTASKFK
jgi:fumarate reductase flavoprotein subunit